MKGLARFAVLLALAALCCGCKDLPAVFEDVGVDPHPPSMQLLGIAIQPPVPKDGVMPPPAFVPPAAGLVIQPDDDLKNTIVLQVSYADAGADIVSFAVRDRDSGLSLTASPAAPQVDTNGDGVLETLDTPDYFSGTSGLVNLVDLKIDQGMNGQHRLEVWAVDSLESRSAKATFTITIQH